MPTSNVIDIFYGDEIDLEAARGEGIIAVIHKATEGMTFRDPKYLERRRRARDLGLLWGAFHFARNSDWESQVHFFLETAEPEQGDLVAWDWEAARHARPMTWEHVRDSVELIQQTLGRYPVLYGGKVLREAIGDAEDSVLKHCPLWYSRYASAPLGVPPRTWPDSYTLWQYTAAEQPSQARNPPGPLQVAGRFVDRNFYRGDDADLRAKWPFT